MIVMNNYDLQVQPKGHTKGVYQVAALISIYEICKGKELTEVGR